MLDSDFNARLRDFSLAHALDEEKTSSSEVEGVAGTLGYIALECFLTGKTTQQSDVYAFGVVLLEIVCGLRPGTRIDEFHFLVNWVLSLHREGRILDAIEERLEDEYVVEEAQKVLVLALACSHPIARERPRTQAIVRIISGFVPSHGPVIVIGTFLPIYWTWKRKTLLLLFYSAKSYLCFPPNSQIPVIAISAHLMGLAVKLLMIAAMLLCFTAVMAQNLKTFTATYGPFNYTYFDIFDQENSANTSNGVLQLTPNSAYLDGSSGMPLENQVGRTLLKRPFTLSEPGYNKTSGRVASFNSSFLFSVCPLGRNTTPGEGLAFIIAQPYKYWLPSKSFGQYLGLTNKNIDGDPTNSLVAIEFDNVKQEFNPDANHVGLNIHSIVSTVTSSLTPLGIELSPDDEARFYNVWVQYDGVSKVIEVYIARQAELDGETPSRPDTPVLKSNLDLGEVLKYNEYSYFGFSASTGNNVQLNCIFRWNLTVESYEVDEKSYEVDEHPPKHPSWQKTLLVVGVGVPLLVIGVPLLVIGVAVTSYYFLRKKRSMVQFKSDILPRALTRLPGTSREFQFNDLKKATNNFDEKNKLGQGGFGVVYRGHLHDENLEVAVKWFSRKTIKGQDDFLAELTIINRLRHKNLVRLLVLLEIVCGLRPGTRIDEFHCSLDWVWSLHREGRILDAIEERLGDEYVVEEAQKVLVLALACSHPIASERPRTQAIVHIILGLVPVPYVPPFKPTLLWPSMPALEEYDISSLGSTTEIKSFLTTHLGSGFTPQCISRELYAGDKFKSV
ncbi:hypothetical protein RHMOL_Rhmol08G0029100 [Rhododendron molle]|uniref:Uncharacterized protein n=1 Tax=Rhododendron molle TaxID=49168 RepID=A0ACC0MJD9_RHOML|nr:hypothetical protein RHMOL_Rhmol08G0029100 [Rhododendron molle]